MRLYDLVLADGRPLSPFCWRAKFALAHKGLAFDTVAVGFTEIPNICGGGYRTVPVLEDGNTVVMDSWAIARYLDTAYPAPDYPALFASETEYGISRAIEAAFSSEVTSRFLRLYLLDIHDQARPEDQAYFRESREARFGPLEKVVENREAQVPLVRQALQPLRAVLEKQVFLGGETPSYADYVVLSYFLWARSIATLAFLEPEDPVVAYIERGLDLYGGLARQAKGHELVAR